jgi:hypothetical protein
MRVGCLALFLSVALVGCSREPPGSLVVSVTLDGQPVAGARVELHPLTDLDLGSCFGTTGDDGTAAIQPDTRLTSVRPGEYVVIITRVVPSTEGAESGRPHVHNELPAIYADRTRTPLRVTIEPGHNRPPPFALSSKE